MELRYTDRRAIVTIMRHFKVRKKDMTPTGRRRPPKVSDVRALVAYYLIYVKDDISDRHRIFPRVADFLGVHRTTIYHYIDCGFWKSANIEEEYQVLKWHIQNWNVFRELYNNDPSQPFVFLSQKEIGKLP